MTKILYEYFYYCKIIYDYIIIKLKLNIYFYKNKSNNY